MTYPTPHIVGLRKRVAGAKDAHGNPVVAHDPPVNVPVIAVYPRTSGEPGERNRDLVITGYTVLAPPGTDIGPLDLVVWLGEDWEVDGEMGDWNTGPFDWRPGVQINLRRAEG